MASTLKLKEGMEPFPGYRLEKLLGSGGWGEVEFFAASANAASAANPSFTNSRLADSRTA